MPESLSPDQPQTPDELTQELAAERDQPLVEGQRHDQTLIEEEQHHDQALVKEQRQREREIYRELTGRDLPQDRDSR